MSNYYLMAQLPSLDGITDTLPMPITEERFYELCNRFLGKREIAILNALTLVPKPDGKRTGNALIDTWNKAECELRLALCEARANKMNKPYKKNNCEISEIALKTAGAAVEMTDPLEEELFLAGFRLAFLESLRPSDPFSISSLYYYGLKLKLLAHTRSFDAARGEREYRNIYEFIIRGENQESKIDGNK